MELQLTIERPDGTVSQFRFTEEPVTIGSATANHIVLQDAALAPHQLIIFRERGDWVIRNLADGPEIYCGEKPVGKGDTRPLGHEAHVRMGTYHLQWCADAAPVGAQSELARPSAEESLPTEEEAQADLAAAAEVAPVGAMDTPASRPPEFMATLGSALPDAEEADESSGAEEVLAALGSSPLAPPEPSEPSEEMASEVGSDSEAAPPPAQDESPAEEEAEESSFLLGDARSIDAELPAALGDPPANLGDPEPALVPEPEPLPDVLPNPYSQSAEEEEAPSEPQPNMVDLDMPMQTPELVPADVRSPDEVDLAGLEQAIESAQPAVATATGAAHDPVIEEPHTPGVIDEDVQQEIVTSAAPRITVHGLRRMVQFKTCQLLVSITGSASDITPWDGGRRSEFVRVVPSYPGSVVTPTSARLDLSQGAKGVKFWITPVSVGRHKDACLNVLRKGSKPARLKMPCRVVSRRPTAWFAFLALAMALFTFLAEAQAWSVTDSIVTLVPPQASPMVAEAFEFAGFLNCGLGLAGLFLLLALVSHVRRRTRSVTITAGFSRS
jgi:hypothetical protein